MSSAYTGSPPPVSLGYFTNFHIYQQDYNHWTGHLEEIVKHNSYSWVRLYIPAVPVLRRLSKEDRQEAGGKTVSQNKTKPNTVDAIYPANISPSLLENADDLSLLSSNFYFMQLNLQVLRVNTWVFVSFASCLTLRSLPSITLLLGYSRCHYYGCNGQFQFP